MSSSLCSVTLGWMPSFWAASSTCCPDTATDSNRDDISIRNTSSSVVLTVLQLKYLVLECFLCGNNCEFTWLHLPGGGRCQVLCRLGHSHSCPLQLTEAFRVLLAVAQQHQVVYVASNRGDHALHGHSPDQAMIQWGRHPAAKLGKTVTSPTCSPAFAMEWRTLIIYFTPMGPTIHFNVS